MTGSGCHLTGRGPSMGATATGRRQAETTRLVTPLRRAAQSLPPVDAAAAPRASSTRSLNTTRARHFTKLRRAPVPSTGRSAFGYAATIRHARRDAGTTLTLYERPDTSSRDRLSSATCHNRTTPRYWKKHPFSIRIDLSLIHHTEKRHCHRRRRRVPRRMPPVLRDPCRTPRGLRLSARLCGAATQAVRRRSLAIIRWANLRT